MKELLLWGFLTLARASPILDQNGFKDLIVAIDDTVDMEKGPEIIAAIKELMTQTSSMMYYASNTRFYIKDVTILTPKGWRLPEISGEARHGEIYEHAAIQVTKKDKEMGEVPYTHQPGGCMEEGHPVVISDEYLINIMDAEALDDTIIKYGPIGNVLTQEFTKYRYGIFEEYGYPGKPNGDNSELFPSVQTQAFYERNSKSWRMTAVNNTCADWKLEGKWMHIEGEKDSAQSVPGCDFDEQTGMVLTDSCFFAADRQNFGLSSMGSYQYTDMVTVFCDEDLFPHNHDTTNKQNLQCLDEARGWEPMSTFQTILKHVDYQNGHNPGGYVESTVPEFTVVHSSNSKFVLVLDDSGSMSSCNRVENLKVTIKRWIDQLALNTKVAIVKFGSSSTCLSGNGAFNQGCYVLIKDDNDRKSLWASVDRLTASAGSTYMGEALMNAYKIMADEHTANQGSPGVVMLVTDGAANGQVHIDDQAVTGPFHIHHIRVVSLIMGAQIDPRMKTLVSETGGKAFVSEDCAGTGSSGAFQYASETFIPSDVGDKATKSVTTSTEIVVGAQTVAKCRNDGVPIQECTLKHSFTIESIFNKEVNIEMRITEQNAAADAQNFIADVAVLDNSTKVEGFTLSFEGGENKAFANFKHIGDVPPNYTEQILDVTVKPVNPTGMIRATIEFETTAKRNFGSDADEDYYITCAHPPVMETNKPFKIQSRVLRGKTPIQYANVWARVHISRANDADAATPPVFFELVDDGKETTSGDMQLNDGTYTTTLTPAQLHIEDGTAISVMCNLVESPGGKWNDNNFYDKKKSLPSQEGTFSPFCCGTKDQAWNNPKTKDVVRLMRSSIPSMAFLDPSLFEKDADFGPPARIVDLKAEKVGDANDGHVRLTWTATGDDWGTGSAQTYNMVYSDKRKGLMSSNMIHKDSRMLVAGSMEPLSAGHQMEVMVKLEDFHIPGTYMFAINATDDAGKVSMPSNVARVNFHDGSPLVMDADPHEVHGHPKNDMSFEDKIRTRHQDERIVQGYLAHVEKNRIIVRNAENNVMERKLKKKMGLKSSAVEKLMEKIKKDDVLRAIYKSKLL